MHAVRRSAEPDALLKARRIQRGRLGSGGVRTGVRFFSDFSDTTKSTARHCPYESLFCAGVTDGPPSSAHPAGERIVRYEPSIPNGTDELVFADHAVSVPHEMDQYVEHLWLDVYDRAFSTKLTPITIDLPVSENKS